MKFKDYCKLNFDLYDIFIPFCLLGFFILIVFYIHEDASIEKEIIKKSEEYTIYKECTKIQGKYYCK